MRDPTGVEIMEKFAPVVVNKGRKFRGEAYWIGAAEHTTSYQIPVEVDVVGVVESTINWALKLGYSTAKCIRIAFKALSKKGVMSNEAFIPALDITLTLRGLNKYMDKYLPQYIPGYKSVC